MGFAHRAKITAIVRWRFFRVPPILKRGSNEFYGIRVVAVLEDPTNVHTIPNGERLLTILNKSSPLVVARVSPRKIWFASIPSSETPPLKNGGDFFSLNYDPCSYSNGI